jgi:hypothetical protein
MLPRITLEVKVELENLLAKERKAGGARVLSGHWVQ